MIDEYCARQPEDPAVTIGGWIGFAMVAGVDLPGAADTRGVDVAHAERAVDAYIDWLKAKIGSTARPRSRRGLPPGWRIIPGERA